MQIRTGTSGANMYLNYSMPPGSPGRAARASCGPARAHHVRVCGRRHRRLRVPRHAQGRRRNR